MGKRQRTWAKRKHAELIALLGGKCMDPECDGTSDTLQIDHMDGRDYEVRKLEWSSRVSRYLKEHKQGVRLRVLCGKCNRAARNIPKHEEPPREEAF